MSLFDNIPIAKKTTSERIFSEDAILNQAISDFKQRGFIFKDLCLFECMQELNELTLKKDDECLFSTLGYDVADTYHKHRFYASAIGMKSQYENFHIHENIKKTLKMSLRYEKKLVHRRYSFFNIVNGTQGCANFRPAFAKLLYNKHCKGGYKVLDTSTGYGGRLIGFLSSIASEYVGIDPNAETHRANEKIRIDLGQHKEVKLFNCPAETWDNSKFLNYFDFAFTSPPYFKKEIYSEDISNSCNAYPEYSDWRERFLNVMIDKTYQSLKGGALYLLNIEDVKIKGVTYPLIEGSIDAAKSVGFQLVKKEVFPFRNSNKGGDAGKGETILVFQKNR